MLRYYLLFLFAPLIAHAQPIIPTEFPPDAVPFASDALKERMSGKTFSFVSAAGDAVRIQYQASYAYFNIGRVSDSGKWSVEGSSICYDWKKYPRGCSEHRKAGELIYVKRNGTGEVVLLQQK